MAAQLSRKPVTLGGVRVRCSQLHAPGIVLVGDAGHGVTPKTGNGMNSALEDSALLSRLLDASGGDLAALPAAFTAARRDDAAALLWLDTHASERNGNGAWGRLHPLAIASGAAMAGRVALRKVAPEGWVAPPAIITLNDT